MKLIDVDKIRRKVEHEMDMQDTYLPVHFLEIVEGMPNEYPDAVANIVCKLYKIFDRANFAYCKNMLRQYNSFVDDMISECEED